jgi:hypothetical protein
VTPSWVTTSAPLFVVGLGVAGDTGPAVEATPDDDALEPGPVEPHPTRNAIPHTTTAGAAAFEVEFIVLLASRLGSCDVRKTVNAALGFRVRSDPLGLHPARSRGHLFG